MVGLVVVLGWVAYTGGLWGYCLIKGYDITWTQMLSSTWPPNTSSNNSGNSSNTSPDQTGSA